MITDLTPASSTRTENFRFSVRRFATTGPAVPPKVPTDKESGTNLFKRIIFTTNYNEIVLKAREISHILINLG
jgi:hypothetical protein